MRGKKARELRKAIDFTFKMSGYIRGLQDSVIKLQKRIKKLEKIVFRKKKWWQFWI